ncbi:MAG: uncharacterized protein JWL93_1010 [Hyphomicrobiales bacterium]|nr:uncharacterized protein [Hyphomicrobiales bacterium]
MKWIVALVGLLLASAGGLSIWDGLNIIQVERGWVGVIGGSVALVGGLILMAISLIVSRLESILDLLAEPPQALPLQGDRLARDEVPETVSRNLRSAFYQDDDAPSGREVPPPPREVPVEPLPLAHPAEKDEEGSTGFERWAPREAARKEFRFTFPPVPTRPVRPDEQRGDDMSAAAEHPENETEVRTAEIPTANAAEEAAAFHADDARVETEASADAAAERPPMEDFVTYEPPARTSPEAAPFELAGARAAALRAASVEQVRMELAPAGETAADHRDGRDGERAADVPRADVDHTAGQSLEATGDPSPGEPRTLEASPEEEQARNLADVPPFYRSDADDDQIYVAELRGSFTDSAETEPVVYEPAADPAQEPDVVTEPEAQPEAQVSAPQDTGEETTAPRRKAGLFPLRWKTETAASEPEPRASAPPAREEEPIVVEAAAPSEPSPEETRPQSPPPSGATRRPAVENTDWLERALSGVDEPPPPRNFSSRLGGKPDLFPARSGSSDAANGVPAAATLREQAAAPREQTWAPREPAWTTREPIVAPRETAEYRQPEPPRAPEPVASLPALAEPSVVGRYEAQGTSYVMYSDGSIDAETETGSFRFASLAELKKFIERRA